MYFPYLRGKQYELILLRENANLIQEAGFIPIIEPVKENTRGLLKSSLALFEVGASSIIIMNPIHGDHSDELSLLDDEELKSLREEYPDNFIVGLIVNQNTELDEFIALLRKFDGDKVAIIHYGYTKPKSLKAALAGFQIAHHVFISEYTSDIYRRRFRAHNSKILIENRFKKQSNKNYPLVEPFSDLHIVFNEKGMTGFGDFTITNDEYSESGGPAFAVAIHLTDYEIEEDIVDEEDDDDPDMVMRHFVSDTNGTAADPGGKFLEALSKLRNAINKNDVSFTHAACAEYMELYTKQHYPGLGYIKKLSMQHHLELMQNYLNSYRAE